MDRVQNEVMKSIEKVGEQKVVQILQQPMSHQDTAKRCVDVIREGGKDFEKSMGRPMSYSEMRSMFG